MFGNDKRQKEIEDRIKTIKSLIMQANNAYSDYIANPDDVELRKKFMKSVNDFYEDKLETYVVRCFPYDYVVSMYKTLKYDSAKDCKKAIIKMDKDLLTNHGINVKGIEELYLKEKITQKLLDDKTNSKKTNTSNQKATKNISNKETELSR